MGARPFIWERPECCRGRVEELGLAFPTHPSLYRTSDLRPAGDSAGVGPSRLIFRPPRSEGYARRVRARFALGVVLVVAAAGCGGSKQNAPPATTSSTFRGTELAGGTPSPDFALRDQDGRFVRLSALRGKTVLVTFLYTHCPDVCPIIATNLDTAARGLRGVRVLAVSVDPKRDTPAAARHFLRARAVGREFRFLVGTRAQLARVWRAYHIAVQPGLKGTVTHSAYTLLIDRRGRQRVLYDAQAKAAAVRHDLRLLALTAR